MEQQKIRKKTGFVECRILSSFVTFTCERIQGFLFFFKEESRVLVRDCPPLILTGIPLRNRSINPYVLHTRPTIRYIIIFRVGRIS